MTDTRRTAVRCLAGRQTVAAAVAMWLWAGTVSNLLAGQYINLGVVDGLAFGTPQVIVQVQGPGGTPTFGPISPNNVFLLDTGSNFVTVVGDAARQMDCRGVRTIPHAIPPGAQQETALTAGTSAAAMRR